jgi:DNA-binding MarR family transcriptional regulator
LTVKQLEALAAIDRLTKANGYAPTHREIAEAIGLSLHALQSRLDYLADGGFIDRPWAIQRAIRLTRQGRAYLRHHIPESRKKVK